MQRLLLIHVMLWSLVCAIPEQDMSLIKQAQQLTENAYKTIMQNTLQIANYRAQQIIACNAVRADEIDWWQNWIDLPKVEKRNLTEDEIQQLDDGPGNDEMLNNPYMPRDAIEQRLNECTNNTYKEKLSRSFQKAEDYLKIFEHEVSLKLRDTFKNETSSKMQSVSKATRQANVKLFEFYEKSDNVYYFLLTVDQLDDF
ncbi:hypothetical protein ACLKA6_012660 [Drosophila palustris]